MKLMNITNRDYFTFNVDNSLLLVGQTGSGKTELVKTLIRHPEWTHSPTPIQYALFDMKACEFTRPGADYPAEQLYFDIVTDPTVGLDRLDELAQLAEIRSNEVSSQPVSFEVSKHQMLFIYIEECDMAAVDQARFDKAVIAINTHAARANIKLIYSTSRPAPDVVSKQLIASFDLILAGQLASKADADYVGVPYRETADPFSFLVSQYDDVYDSDGKPRDMINISNIDLIFGGENEPHDEHLSELLQQAYIGAIDCRQAIVPIELIVPFSSFVPPADASYANRFIEAYKAGTPPSLYVYEKDGVFIMSDDYTAYAMYKTIDAKLARCTVIGDATINNGVEYGPPFKLPLPTFETI